MFLLLVLPGRGILRDPARFVACKIGSHTNALENFRTITPWKNSLACPPDLGSAAGSVFSWLRVVQPCRCKHAQFIARRDHAVTWYQRPRTVWPWVLSWKIYKIAPASFVPTKLEVRERVLPLCVLVALAIHLAEMARRASKESLEAFVSAILRAEGVDEWQVQCTTNSLVSASLSGVDSHGIRLLTMYVASLRGERVKCSEQRVAALFYYITSFVLVLLVLSSHIIILHAPKDHNLQLEELILFRSEDCAGSVQANRNQD